MYVGKCYFFLNMINQYSPFPSTENYNTTRNRGKEKKTLLRKRTALTNDTAMEPATKRT